MLDHLSSRATAHDAAGRQSAASNIRGAVRAVEAADAALWSAFGAGDVDQFEAAQATARGAHLRAARLAEIA